MKTQYRMIASLLTLMETMPYQQITQRDIVAHVQQSKAVLLSKDRLLATYIQSQYSVLSTMIYDSEISTLKDVLMIFFGFWEQHQTLLVQLKHHGLMDMFRIECKSFFFDTLSLLDTNFDQSIESKLQFAAAFISGAVTDMLIESTNHEKNSSRSELATFAHNMFKSQYFIEND